ncbi:MAG: PQQ-dependent sugar dehydrogenase [Pirellulales bacterium]|nr:PQQ-dependent sugar dehydrogenase [Pirellulales bacterium]
MQLRRTFALALISVVLVVALGIAIAQTVDLRSAAAEDLPKTSPVSISSDPAPVKIERAFPNLTFERPIFLTYPPDGTNRIAVVSQYGKLFLFANDQRVEQPALLLDIVERVEYKDRENEEGLLGLAFHPRFKQNGELFVYYTAKGGLKSVISRFRLSKDNPQIVDPQSEEILLEIKQPFWNHNGGTIVFGPDGYLYIGLGDGGAANDPHGNAQNIGTLLGKILRIDVDHHDLGQKYASPKDNPFVDVPDARPEIWALGIRNVWRIAFDRVTGKLWAGEVGQNTWEEIDIIERGGNYGWNLRESFHKFTEFNLPPKPGPVPAKIVGKPIDPIFEYHHDLGKSITGGNIYRGKHVPALVGKYLFADYVSGEVYVLTYDETIGKATAVHRIDPKQMPVFSFGEDETGETYFLTTQGTIHWFRPE